MANNKDHQNNFTLLRLLLAVMIVITHSYGITGHGHDHLFSAGNKMWGSVRLNMFFFISGFLVTRSALTSKKIIPFLLKRVLRIYPALIILVLFSIYIVGPLFSTFNWRSYFIQHQTWKYFFTASGFHIEYYLPGLFQLNPSRVVNASLWTLTLELKLYLLVAFCVVSGFLFTRFYKWFALVTAAIFLLLAIKDFEIEGTAYGARIWSLMAIYQFGSALQVMKLHTKQVLVLLGISLVFISLRSLSIIPVRIYVDELIFFSSLTWLLAYYPRLNFKLKNDYSYGLYLYAFPIQQILIQLSENKMHPAINILLTIMIAGCLAMLSWKYIEKPILDLKKYL